MAGVNQEYSPVSAAQFEAIRAALSKQGLKVPGYAGELKQHGADVEYAYDAAAQRLTLVLKAAPGLLGLHESMDAFAQQVEDAVRAHLD